MFRGPAQPQTVLDRGPTSWLLDHWRASVPWCPAFPLSAPIHSRGLASRDDTPDLVISPSARAPYHHHRRRGTSCSGWHGGVGVPRRDHGSHWGAAVRDGSPLRPGRDGDEGAGVGAAAGGGARVGEGVLAFVARSHPQGHRPRPAERGRPRVRRATGNTRLRCGLDLVLVVWSDSCSVVVGCGGSWAQDQYILHTAEAQDITLPFACRHGCCTSCAVRIKSGQIRQPEALGISAELKDKGYALLCVGFPTSDVEVETQDEDEVYWLQFGRYFARGPVERDDYALELAMGDE